MARTFARTGRSMKNFEIILKPDALVRGRGTLLGVDLLARDRTHDAADDHAVVLSEALLDHPQIADELAGLDLALLDDVVLVDDEHIAAALIAAERNIRH